MYTKKRDALCAVLTKCKLPPIIPHGIFLLVSPVCELKYLTNNLSQLPKSGSYFVLADTSAVPDRLFYDSNSPLTRDFQFCNWLTSEIKVVRANCFFKM